MLALSGAAGRPRGRRAQPGARAAARLRRRWRDWSVEPGRHDAFIRGIDEPVAAVVRSVVGLGERLGMTITAEGVETEEQLSHVRRKGCTEVQGILLRRPLSADHVRALVEKRAAV